MTFFQNLFEDYEGYWDLGDFSSFSLAYKVPGNKNKGDSVVAWNKGPHDLTGKTNLTINFAFDKEFKNWAKIAIDVSGVVVSETKNTEIKDILNTTASFSDWFVAGLNSNGNLTIRPKKAGYKYYFDNSGAELKLKFNKYAGIADIPSYFDKDTIANRFAEGSNGQLIRISHAITANTAANPSVITSAAHGLTSGDTIYIVNSNSTPTIDGQRVVTVINSNSFSVPVNVSTAGSTGEWLSSTEYQLLLDKEIDYSTMKPDWEHLGGRTCFFKFTKNTIDGSNRITQQVIYDAGAKPGSLVKKIFHTYSGANTTPTTTIEIPYVLLESDLISP